MQGYKPRLEATLARSPSRLRGGTRS